jgi:glutamyl-tRNA reductase
VPIVCIGLSHHTAPVEVRERHAFPASKMSEALIALRDYQAVREALMLQTCNRLEIYAELEDYETGVAQIKRFLQNFRHSDVSDMDSYLYTLLGSQAIDHLFRVSTGLDSMLIGEAEILGQVKEAYVQAQKARSLGTILHYLFRLAIGAGKMARSQTWIGSESISVASAAVELAKARLGTLSGSAVLVLGAGRMGTLVAKRIRAEGASSVTMLNRAALESSSIVSALAQADVVVTCTAAADFVLTPGDVAEALLERPNRKLFIVDIAVPRDVDPEVSLLPNIELIDIDGVRGVVETGIERRREAIPLVEEIIGEHVGRFQQWYQARVAVPVIRSLTRKAETIREGEIERLFSRCPELGERERMLITGMSMTIISRLLHSAITRIRDKAINNQVEALTDAQILDELFDLDVRGELATLLDADFVVAPD